jgi:hypothetical protein
MRVKDRRHALPTLRECVLHEGADRNEKQIPRAGWEKAASTLHGPT